MDVALLIPVIFICMLLFLFIGFPVGFSMIALAFIFGIPIFGDVIGLQMGGMVFNLTLNYSYACIPMFILTGLICRI